MEHSKYAPKSAPAAVSTTAVSTETSKSSKPITPLPKAAVEAAEFVPAPVQTVFPPAPEAPAPSTMEEVPAPLPDMNEFASTRPPDDLFADDFEPMAETIVEQAVEATATPVVSEITPIANVQPETLLPQQQEQQQPPQRGGGVGGGRGSRRGNKDGTSKLHSQQLKINETSTKTAENTPPKVEAVSGDRSGTGGVKKAKLTEEELTARMEAMKIKNASLEAAHARAEADETTFNAREAEEQERQRRDRQNRQQMMGEREKNRQRKLQALGGREWDAEKPEQIREYGNEDRRGRSQYSRGAHGGIAPSHREPATEDTSAAAPYEWNENSTRGGRGRGGRGIRGGRGGRGAGRAGGSSGGGRGDNVSKPDVSTQTVPAASDFPALPRSDKSSAVDGKPPIAITTYASALPKQNATSASSKAQTSDKTDGQTAFTPTASWADQMDSPIVPTGAS